MTHTPTPWKLNKLTPMESQVRDANNKWVGNLSCFSDKLNERIVACVNACAHMEDPVKEILELNRDYRNQFKEIAELKARVKELENRNCDMLAMSERALSSTSVSAFHATLTQIIILTSKPQP